MIARKNTNDRMSQIVQHGGLVYLSGQVASNTDDGIAEQTASVLSKIEALLEGVETPTSNVISATIYLADMSDFAAMNAIWDRWFPTGSTPVRTCVEAKLARAEVLVEITIIAAEHFAKD